MIVFAAGTLFVAASAAGWVLFGLVAVDVARWHWRLRDWRPVGQRDEDRP